MKISKIQTDWWSKTFSGLFLGGIIACCVGAIVTWLSIGKMDAVLAPQMGMWAIPWVWCSLFFLAFFIPKGWQAIISYSVTSMIAYAMVVVLRG